MSENPYNPDDPAFLASRSLDEDLCESERQRLSEALEASDALRSEAQKLRAVDHLVKRWGREEIELDWNTYSRLAVAKALAESEAKAGGKLDDLLKRWGDGHVEIDGEVFTQAVMAGIKPRRRRRPLRSLILRLGAPLAAAAALAIVVTAAFWARSLRGPTIEVSFPGRAATIHASIVSFRREPIETVAPQPTAPGISFMAIGVAPVTEQWQDETPPL